MEGINNMRDYPLVYGDSIMTTFKEYRAEGFEPKEAWQLARHLHVNHNRFLANMAKIDAILPYQKDENFF